MKKVKIMRLLIKDRGTGKTTQLIYTSEATGLPIAVETSSRIDLIMKMANEMNCYIPKPILIKDLIEHKYRYENVLIDEAEKTIENALNHYLNCNVIAATLSNSIKEVYKHE